MHMSTDKGQKFSIEQAIVAVRDSPSSIFTREDVLGLLGRLAGGDEVRLSDALLDRLRDVIETFPADQVVSFESAVFRMEDDRVRIESMEVDPDTLYNLIVDAIESGEETDGDGADAGGQEANKFDWDMHAHTYRPVAKKKKGKR